MFQNLANYLLGSVINQENQGATTEGVENDNLRLRTAEQDEWVLVDRDSEGNSDDGSSVASLDDLEDINLRLPIIRTRTSSTSSLPCATNMEESWFVTPPPCFTSAGPIHMETSPLENLLIEHPSMSVYHIHQHPSRRHFTVTVPVRSTSADTEQHVAATEAGPEDEEVVLEERREAVVAVERVAPRSNRLQFLQQQQERQLVKGRRAQKMQVQKACQGIKRGTLERYNKAREVNSRNRRQRRGERSQGATRSHANNNRKC